MSTKKISIAEIILWIFIIALIFFSLTPFALGFKINADYSKMINDLSEMSELDVQIEKYERGFFSSDAVLSITIPNLPEKILFKEEIVHGPIYFGLLAQGKSPFVAALVKGQLDVSATQQPMVKKIFAGGNTVVYQTIIGFSGDVDTQAYMPALNVSIEDENGPLNIQSAGVVLNEHYSPVDGQLRGDAQIPSLKIQTALMEINTQSINVSFSGAMGNNQVMIGDSVVSMNLLDIDTGDDQFTVRDLTLRSVTSENGNLINSSGQINIREIFASNQKLGPVKLNASVNGINAQSLNQLQQIQKDVEAKLEQGLPAEQVNAMMAGQIMGIIPDLIKQAEITVNPFSINSELGKLEADIEFMLEGIDANAPADPMFLLGAISLDLNVSIDEALLKQFISWELENNQQADLHLGSDSSKKIEAGIPMDQKVSENIQGMLDENWLVRNDSVYLSKISMHQGELLINDKPVDPMQQVMSSMGGEVAAP